MSSTIVAPEYHARSSERGNALFLILIAVVLFAALSFAITQSNRSTGSSAGEETNTVSGSNITQYGSAIRTGITRMLVKGAALEDLKFNTPSDGAAYTTDPTLQVYNPQGGAVVYNEPDSNLVNTGGKWVYVMAPIADMGTGSNDAVAILTKVKKGICQQINRQVGLPAPTVLGTTIAASALAALVITTPSANTFDLGSTPNKPYGCFLDSDGNSNYMHVLAEQ